MIAVRQFAVVVAVVLASAVATPALAQTHRLGSLLSGAGAPDSRSFATLTATAFGDSANSSFDGFAPTLFSGGERGGASRIDLGGGVASLSFGNASAAGNFTVHLQDIGRDRVESALVAAAVTPVPEPSTYALMLAGLAVVGFTLRRRSR